MAPKNEEKRGCEREKMRARSQQLSGVTLEEPINTEQT